MTTEKILSDRLRHMAADIRVAFSKFRPLAAIMDEAATALDAKDKEITALLTERDELKAKLERQE